MKLKKIVMSGIIFLAITFLIGIPLSRAQIYWWPLPPYNTLWPLWSPVLSPPNALGIPIPIVSSLTPETVLPVQPGLTWDPALKYPWLLYNTPSGLAFYDPYFGIDLWPPDYLNILGIPLPITLTSKWSTLAPTDTNWISAVVPIANNAYYSTYPQFAPLGTPADFLGIPVLIPNLIP